MSNQKCGLFQVIPYHFSMNDVEITVFDTPGLADGTGNEAEYLAKIKGKVTDFDVFIFCTETNSQRFRNDDINTVEKLTEAFGSKLWEYSVVVLTFANEVYPPPSKKGVFVQEFFDHRMRCFKKKIRDVILNAGVADEVMITVPFVAAGDLGEPRLPGMNNWLTEVQGPLFFLQASIVSITFLHLSKTYQEELIPGEEACQHVSR